MSALRRGDDHHAASGAAHYARFDDVDRANGRKLQAWWSPELGAAGDQLSNREFDHSEHHPLNFVPLVDAGFVHDASGDRAHRDEAAAVVQRHLAGEVHREPAEGIARRLTHRLASWLKSLRGRS